MRALHAPSPILLTWAMSVLLLLYFNVATSGVAAAFGPKSPAPAAPFARSVEAAKKKKTKLATLGVRGGAQFSPVVPARAAASASSTGDNSKSTEAVTTVYDDGDDGNDDDGNDDDDSKVFRQAAAVGAVSAGMGYAYGKVLDCTVKSVWERLPHVLAERGIDIGGGYITYTCAVGGLLMGLLSRKLQPTYIVADFVSTLSGSEDNKSSALPGLLPSLPNLLLLSLVTSTFGFSVGPEAPMVCAGGLVGAAMARNWYKSNNNNINRAAEIMTYAGAAGALTAFMGIPLAGPIFALELTQASAGMAPSTSHALGPSVAASAVGLILIRGVLMSGAIVGGHFTYGPVSGLSGRAAIATAIVCGTGGALLGTAFHKAVHILKDMLWKQRAPAAADKEDGRKKSSFVSFILHRDVFVKTLIGIAVGILSVSYPQTMFWGEGSLQCVVDGHQTPFAATKHGLSRALTASARVNPDILFQSAWDAAQIGLAKLLSITLACAGKFPGGIIFPLFFAAAPLAHAALTLLSSSLPAAVAPVAVMSLMASTQASVTRTPLATILMLALSSSSATELSKMLPSVILSSYIGVWFSRFLSTKSYFNYSA